MEVVETRTPSGVRMLTADVAGTVSAALVFGVARRDEPLPLRGITSLVATLAFDRLKPLSFRAGWTPTANDVAFRAQGSSSDVAGFFSRLANSIRALSDVDADEIAHTIATITRLKRHTSEVMSSMFTARYGLDGYGFEGIASLRAEAMTPDAVADWASRWLVAENAVVVSSGSLGGDFDLDLPHVVGSSFSRAAGPTPTIVELPSVVHSTEIDLACSLVMPADIAAVVWRPVLQELHSRLVDIDGVDAGTRAVVTPIDEHNSIVDFVVREPLGHLALESFVSALRAVAQSGASSESLALAREKVNDAYDGHRSNVRELLLPVATAILCGFPRVDLDSRRAAASSVTTDDVAAAVSAAFGTLIVGLDRRKGIFANVRYRAETLGVPFDRRDARRVVDSAVWRRRPRFSKVFRTRRRATNPGRKAVVTAEGVLVKSKSNVQIIAFDRLAIVGAELPGLVTMVDRDGGSVLFGRRSWSRAFLRAIVAAAPERLVEKW